MIEQTSGAWGSLLVALSLVGCGSAGSAIDRTADASVADGAPDATLPMEDAESPDALGDSAVADVAFDDAPSAHDAHDGSIRDSMPETAQDAPDARDAHAEGDSHSEADSRALDGTAPTEAATDAVALDSTRAPPPPGDSSVREAEASVGPLADGGVPSPGSGDLVDFSFASVAPNATPAEATPLGTSALADLVVWVGANAIGGPEDPANYFVFESAPDAVEFEFNMCFAGSVTAMTATLWEVQQGVQVLPPVAMWTVSGTCVGSYSAPLAPSTTYLFGVEATGGPGTYTA